MYNIRLTDVGGFIIHWSELHGILLALTSISLRSKTPMTVITSPWSLRIVDVRWCPREMGILPEMRDEGFCGLGQLMIALKSPKNAAFWTHRQIEGSSNVDVDFSRINPALTLALTARYDQEGSDAKKMRGSEELGRFWMLTLTQSSACLEQSQ